MRSGLCYTSSSSSSLAPPRLAVDPPDASQITYNSMTTEPALPMRGPLQGEIYTEKHFHLQLTRYLDALGKEIDKCCPMQSTSDHNNNSQSERSAERERHRGALRKVLFPGHALLQDKVKKLFEQHQQSLMRQDRLLTVQAALFADLLILGRAIARQTKILVLDEVVSSSLRLLDKVAA